MKAKTIAKLTRILIALVVAFIFAVPVISGFNNFQMTSGEIVGTDSEYYLDDMTEDDVDMNITNAVTEPTKNYSISYTCKDGSKKVIQLNFSSMNDEQRSAAIKDAAKKMLDNTTPDCYKEGTTATLLDSEGRIVQQQTIVGNKNYPVETVLYTGMKLTSSAVKTFVPEVSINTRNNGELVKISDVQIMPSDDAYVVKIKIPYIVLGTAFVQSNNVTLGIALQYNNFFNLELALDLPITTFIGNDVKLPEIHVKEDKTAVEVDLSEYGLEDAELSIDTVKVTIKDGKVKVETTDGRTIVETLESYVNTKGELEYVYEGKVYTLDKEMSESLITIVKSIMNGGS